MYNTLFNFRKEYDLSDLPNSNQTISLLITYTNPIFVYIFSF